MLKYPALFLVHTAEGRVLEYIYAQVTAECTVGKPKIKHTSELLALIGRAIDGGATRQGFNHFYWDIAQGCLKP